MTGVTPNRPTPREVSAFGDCSVLSAAETGQLAAGAGGGWQVVSSAPAVDVPLPRCPPSRRVCQGGGGVLASSEDGDPVTAVARERAPQMWHKQVIWCLLAF